MSTGNKGEWSELYVLLKLLELGRLYAADDKIKRLQNVFFIIRKVFRQEIDGGCQNKFEYRLEDNGAIKICLNEIDISELSTEQLKQDANRILEGIVGGAGVGAFSIAGANEIMNRLHVHAIKATSEDKADIKLELHDIYTGIETICAFSIKSELGAAPTLLNASGATNFKFEIQNINDSIAEQVNSISTREKIKDRIQCIFENNGNMIFSEVTNDIFAENILLFDSRMSEIIAWILIYYYRYGISSCLELANKLEADNPLHITKKGFYTYKLKKFLCAVALGLKPAEVWDGRDEANGGYIIVTTDGEVLAYHIYNRDYFESYLLNKTKLEKGSTAKHHFAAIFKEADKFFINLNLQIRFV